VSLGFRRGVGSGRIGRTHALSTYNFIHWATLFIGICKCGALDWRGPLERHRLVVRVAHNKRDANKASLSRAQSPAGKAACAISRQTAVADACRERCAIADSCCCTAKTNIVANCVADAGDGDTGGGFSSNASRFYRSRCACGRAGVCVVRTVD